MSERSKPETFTRGEVTVWLMHFASAEDIKAIFETAKELVEGE